MEGALGNQAIQGRDTSGNDSSKPPTLVDAIARWGVQGPSDSVPYQSQLEGHVDQETLSTVEVHTDQRARQATRKLGARAYTVGNQIAFRSTPDPETVAHEVAHVVQQRSGGRPEGGVGRRGDRFERAADRFAAEVSRNGDTADIRIPGGRTVANGTTGVQPVQFLRAPGRSIPPGHRERAKRLQGNTVRGVRNKFDVKIPITPRLLAVLGTSEKRKQNGAGVATGRTGTSDSAESSGTADKTGSKEVAKTADKYSKTTTISSGSESVGGISPGDVKQGQLGDCYLLSAAAAIAREKPHLIDTLIQPVKNKNKYRVTLNPEIGLFGIRSEQTVTVTPTFPASSSGGTPAFAKPGTRASGKTELWPMLIEKAYAKIMGDYNAIEDGFSGEAMQLLGGASLDRLDPSDWSDNKLLSKIASALKDDSKIVTASTISDASKKKQKMLSSYPNLITSHAYSVMAVDQKNGTIDLDNPHGPGQNVTSLPVADFKNAFDTVVIGTP